MTPFRSEKNTNWEGAFRIPLLVRWPGKVAAGSVANGIVQHHDWMPTFLEMAGALDVVEKLKKGYKANGRTYKNHIDGVSLLSYMTGKSKESPRNFFFYISDDGDMLAMRYHNWKLVFLEQRCRGTMQVWAEPFTRLRLTEALQPADGSLRVRRRDLEHVLRLVHVPRVLHLRGPGGRCEVRRDVQGLPADPEAGQLHDRRCHRQDERRGGRRKLTLLASWRDGAAKSAITGFAAHR